MRSKDFDLKNADRKTAERIFAISPPEWDMERVFEASCRKYERYGDHGDVVDEPLEISVKKRHVGVRIAACIASAVCAAIMLLLVDPMELFRKYHDDIPEEKPVVPISTQVTGVPSATGAPSTTFTTEPTSAEVTEQETEVHSVTAEYAPPELPEETEFPTEIPAQPETEPEPTTVSEPDVQEKLPDPGQFASREEYISEAARGIIEGRYFSDYNGDGQFNRLDAEIISSYIVKLDNVHWYDMETWNIMPIADIEEDIESYIYKPSHHPDFVYVKARYDSRSERDIEESGDITGDGVIDEEDAELLLAAYEQYLRYKKEV